MQYLADVLLGAGALGAAIYCYVLARRLTRFNQLESGMGGAIAVLSAQVDDMTKALIKAQATAASSAQSLEDMTKRAEEGAARLEVLMASVREMSDQLEASRKTRSLRRRPRYDEEAAQ